MYENDYNNSQSTNNTNNGYSEYYYTAGNSYEQTGSTPNGKPKKPKSFAKKAVSIACLGAIFGVTAGAAFSLPAYFTTKDLKQV